MVSKTLQNICWEIYKHVQVWVQDNPYIDPEDMCGACGIVSYVLFKVLKRRGHSPKFVLIQTESGFSNHCYVMMNGKIFDLSARQFKQRGKQVDILIDKKDGYFKKIPQLKKYNVILENIKAIKEINTSWEGQSPILYKSKIEYLVRKLSNI